jgi:hypothetical protein
MSTVTERLEALEPQLESLQHSLSERNTLQALRTRAEQINRTRQALETQLRLFELVEQLGGRFTSRPRASPTLRARPTVLKSRLEQNPSDVIDASQWDGSFMEPLGVFTGRLQEAALASWQSLVDEKAPTVGDDVLNQFELAGFSRQVREVRAARDRIRQLRAQVPAADGALAEVVALSTAAARELATLQEVPPEVRAFIARASAGEASLDDLTEQVREWLRNRDMLKLIRISLLK